MTPIRRSLALALALTLAACSGAPLRDASQRTARPHDNLNATLWMQTSAEYEANVRGTFAAATRQLDAALADVTWNALPVEERRDGFETRPPAVIVDADETMIDNSPFQARGIRDDVEYQSERWVAWVNERRARALPGALAFAEAAQARGVTIFFVTNRDAPEEYESTVANLRALGFPVADDASNVLLRGDARAPAREKSGRRRWVAERHRVVLMLGDNLGDFLDGVNASLDERRRLMAPYAAWWGTRWFMLPNPSYGSWESAVLQGCDPSAGKSSDCKRRALRTE